MQNIFPFVEVFYMKEWDRGDLLCILAPNFFLLHGRLFVSFTFKNERTELLLVERDFYGICCLFCLSMC